jgi:hypothetical protein
MNADLQTESLPAYGAEWDKAKIHFDMAKAAMKLAAKNAQGAEMAAEHLERAAATLRSLPPNTQAEPPPKEQ